MEELPATGTGAAARVRRTQTESAEKRITWSRN
jgi:hypothetical protein